MRRWLLIGLVVLAMLAACRPGGTAPSVTATPPAPTPQAGTPAPGLSIRGHVRLGDGAGLAGVTICRSLASYPGQRVATSGPDGAYQAEFFAIPGDEMISVWATLPGYTFEPERYSWRHYYGFEERTLDFVARPAPSGATPAPPCPGP